MESNQATQAKKNKLNFFSLFLLSWVRGLDGIVWLARSIEIQRISNYAIVGYESSSHSNSNPTLLSLTQLVFLIY